MYSTPNFSSKGPPQSPSTQDNFYHVLEGPTPSTGSSPERSTAPGKEEENEYDEPVHPNWDSNKSGRQLGGELFDDPSYQSTFAPVMSTQPHTLAQKLPDSVRADLLPPPPTSPVENKAVVSDPTNSLVLQDYQRLPDRPHSLTRSPRREHGMILMHLGKTQRLPKKLTMISLLPSPSKAGR